MAALDRGPRPPREVLVQLANEQRAIPYYVLADAPLVRCPTLVVVAAQDHVVDPDGGRWLAGQLTRASAVRLLALQEGYHIIPRDRDGPRMASEVGNFLAQLQVAPSRAPVYEPVPGSP